VTMKAFYYQWFGPFGLDPQQGSFTAAKRHVSPPVNPLWRLSEFRARGSTGID
jgi:hypothetical protein